MTGVEELTQIQLEFAYKYAVKASLVRFFRKNEATAEALVESWWRRYSAHDFGEPNLFLHDEAITTAADLAKAEDVPVTPENQTIYDAICEEADRQARLYSQEKAALPRRVA
jgi:hypothetical protein